MSKVKKYTMSEEEYNKLPNSFRAYKIRVGENVFLKLFLFILV